MSSQIVSNYTVHHRPAPYRFLGGRARQLQSRRPQPAFTIHRYSTSLTRRSSDSQLNRAVTVEAHALCQDCTHADVYPHCRWFDKHITGPAALNQAVERPLDLEDVPGAHQSPHPQGTGPW
ncbi:hypothetical protein NX059_006281 [Plenodomus lindquistii]|nr:hypothetical protein NX059_006281 [Plenodomus lindquistii]